MIGSGRLTTTTKSSTDLRIKRMFGAMRKRVFHAWTDVDELSKWWHAGEAFAPSLAEIDLRVGGRYRLGMTSPADDKQTVATGVYREIVPPEKLVFTWRCEDDTIPHEMLVTLELFDHSKNTELILLHEGFLSQGECEHYSHKWNASLAELASFLHEHESPPIELCIVVDAPEDVVFRALTDAEQLMGWFPTFVENEPVVGGKFMYKWEYANDPSQNKMQCGEYTEVIP